MPEIPDTSPAIGPEWQRTRAAYTAITDRIVDLAKAGGGRKSPAVREAFAAVDVALTEMQHAAHAYRDAMAKITAERDALASAIHQSWARSTQEPDPSAAPADLLRRLGEFGDDWRERARKAEAGAAVVALVAAYGDADTIDDRDRAAARIAALTVERDALAARCAFDLVAHLHRQREFSARTFGPGQRTAGVLDHIRKELLEIEREPNDLEEWADLLLLALDGAWRAGHEPEGIAAQLAAKQTKNEGRTWPDWRTAPQDRAIEHVKLTPSREHA